MLLILGLLTAAQVRFDIQTIPGESCSARAMNQLSEVAFECKLPLNSSRLWLWDGTAAQALTGGGGPGCSSASSNGINNARQRLQRETYLSRCGIGGSFSQWNLFLSGGQVSRFDDYYNNIRSLNDSGYFLFADRILWRSPDVVRFPQSITGSYSVTGLNNSMQSLLEYGGGLYRYNWTSGEREQIPVSLRSALLNQRGWVAGLDNRNEIHIWNGATVSQRGTPPGDNLTLIGFNDHGWILGTGSQGPWLFDGSSIDLLANLVAESVSIEAVAGLNNTGTIAATVTAADGKARAVLLSPVGPVDPPAEILNPEAGPELDGRGESVGCDAIAGWVIDRKYTQRNIPLELYEGTRLIGGGIAEQQRADGTWGFRIAVPKKLLDGQPHFVNVRFGGYATAIEQAWGTIECL